MQKDLQIPSGVPEHMEYTAPEGLSSEEAARRMKAGEGNVVADDGSKTVWQLLAGNLFTWFNLLNVLLGVCLLLVGSYRNMLFLCVVVINAVIGTVQEIRAHNTIKKLRVMNQPVVQVLRGGQTLSLHSEELVKGDLVILHGGDQIPADAIVVEGSGSADESLLTGESIAVKKAKGDWLMSGSYVSEGRVTAQLVYVGDESYAARLTHEAKQINRPKSQLMMEIDRLIKLISMALIPLGILLFLKQYLLLHNPLDKAVPSTVAAMIGMIPEGLVLLTSVAMFLGVIRLGRRDALVQELSGIETLARADVLCLDKTGTITTGAMDLERLLPLGGGEDELRRALSRLLAAFDDNSGTLNALRGSITPDESAKEEMTAVLPFSSKRKKSAVSFREGMTLIMGAPQFVLNEKDFASVSKQVEENSGKGYRVLVVAEAGGFIEDEETPAISRILGLCLLNDTLRPNAEKTMEYFVRQGVQLKVISGDDPRTVSIIAKRVGLAGWSNWVDASRLSTPEELEKAAEEYTVFGRVTPSQKKELVDALKKAKHSVAMTGDGVNDIPALKAADCSIAMAGGSDAAKHTAQLTLLNADFSTMPEIVAQGRRVIANITRTATLFLTKTVYSLLLTVILLILPGSYPFQPIQLTLISSLFIGFPSFVMALEPSNERMTGRFLRRVLKKALPGSLTVAACASVSMLMGAFGCSSEVCSTLATLSTAFIGLLTLIKVALPLNKLRTALVIAMPLAFALAVAILGEMFMLVPLAGNQWLILACLCTGGLLLFLLATLLCKKIPE